MRSSECIYVGVVEWTVKSGFMDCLHQKYDWLLDHEKNASLTLISKLGRSNNGNFLSSSIAHLA